MHVKIHRLFEILLETTAKTPEAALGFSLASPPKLGDFLADLDPNLSLDWSGKSFQGLPELRQNVLLQAKLEQICGVEDVLITAGAAEANFLAIMQLVQPGDELITDVPGWPQPLVLGEAIGATIKRLSRYEQDEWRFDFAELELSISSKTKLIFLSNPNNPSGQVLSESELLKVIALAQKVGAYVLVDEVYAGLEWSVPRSPSIAALYERGITTGSVSKALGLQGLRTGWLICRDPKVIREALILRENSSEIMNVMGEVIAEIALRPDRYARALETARNEGLANLRLLEQFIGSRSELSWVSPKAGLIGLARLNLDLNPDDLARQMIEMPYKTFIIPGSAYGLAQHIRLGVGGGVAAQLEQGLSRLSTFLDGLS